MSAIIIARYGTVEVCKDGDRVFWTSKMDIDADGSPHAYHPDSRSGLDFLANAGRPGNWWGLACDSVGRPYIQVEGDPAPGFYVSTTAGLADGTRTIRDPRRYLDSETVPFIVLPTHFPIRVPMLAAVKVTNTHNGLTCMAKYGDVGPGNEIGEGSIALAKALSAPADPRTGGVSAGILFEIDLSAVAA